MRIETEKELKRKRIAGGILVCVLLFSLTVAALGSFFVPAQAASCCDDVKEEGANGGIVGYSGARTWMDYLWYITLPPEFEIGGGYTETTSPWEITIEKTEFETGEKVYALLTVNRLSNNGQPLNARIEFRSPTNALLYAYTAIIPACDDYGYTRWDWYCVGAWHTVREEAVGRCYAVAYFGDAATGTTTPKEYYLVTSSSPSPTPSQQICTPFSEYRCNYGWCEQCNAYGTGWDRLRYCDSGCSESGCANGYCDSATTPTPSPTVYPSPSLTPTPTATVPPKPIPGFGVVVAIAGLLACAYLVLRRKR